MGKMTGWSIVMEMADEAGDGWGAIVSRENVSQFEVCVRATRTYHCDLEASGDGEWSEGSCFDFGGECMAVA